MVDITPESLKVNGWREFSWNGGAVMEYWKSLNDADYFERRIGVRFGEYKNRPLTIYIFGNHTMIQVGNVHHIDHLEMLWQLMRIP